MLIPTFIDGLSKLKSLSSFATYHFYRQFFKPQSINKTQCGGIALIFNCTHLQHALKTQHIGRVRFGRNAGNGTAQIRHRAAVGEATRKVTIVRIAPSILAAHVLAQHLTGRHARAERIVIVDQRDRRIRAWRFDNLPVPLGRLNASRLQGDGNLLAIDVRQGQNIVRSVEDQHVLVQSAGNVAGGVLNDQPVAGIRSLPLWRDVDVEVGCPLPRPEDTVRIGRQMATGQVRAGGDEPIGLSLRA